MTALAATVASARPAAQTAPGDLLDPRTYAPDSRLYLVLHATGVPSTRVRRTGPALYRSAGDPLQDDGLSEAGRHAFSELRYRAPSVAVQGRQLRRGRADAERAGRLGEHRLAAPADGRDDERPAWETTWIQRLNTAGGIAPAGTCTPGATTAVPYSADYFLEGPPLLAELARRRL